MARSMASVRRVGTASVCALAVGVIAPAAGRAEDRLARDLEQALARIDTRAARGRLSEQDRVPVRYLLRALEERHARRQRELDRIARLRLPPKALDRLRRAREADRAATLPLIATVKSLVQPEMVDEKRPTAARDPRARVGEARAILQRMEAASRREPISADTLSVRALDLKAPALGATTGATTSAPVGQVPQLLKTVASQLGGPVDVYEWVRNTIAPEFYYGAMKGPKQTYLERSGNDADTAALLVQLLRAKGILARYARGTVEVPAPALVAVCGTASVEQAVRVLERGGVPHEPVLGAGTIVSVKLERVWAEAYLPYANYRGTLLDRQGGAWIPLDPAFKRLAPPNTFDPAASLGFDAGAEWRDYLSASRESRPLESVRARVGQLLAERQAGTTYDAILNRRDVVSENLGILPNSLPHKVLSLTEVSYDLPELLQHTLRLVAEREGLTALDAVFAMTDLLGRRLTLAYLPFSDEDKRVVDAFGGLTRTPPYLIDVKMVVRLGGVTIAVADAPLGMGVRFTLRMELRTPGGTETVENTLTAGNLTAIGLSGREATASETDTSAASVLAGLAWSYFRRWNDSDEELSRLFRVVPVRPTVSVCLVSSLVDVEYAGGDPLYPLTFDWKGIYVDADFRPSAPVAIVSTEAERAFTLFSGLEGSVLEHRVFEDTYEVRSVSTAKALGLAVEQGTPVHDLTSANAEETIPTLPFGASVIDDVRAAVDRGWHVRIPAAPVSYLRWTGVGYVLLDEETGEAAYQLEGGLSGGMTADELPAGVTAELSEQQEEPEENDGAEVAHIFESAAADFQEGTVNQVLPLPLEVRVVDEEGNAVEGATVTFVVSGGGGKLIDLDGRELDTVAVLSDASGAARVRLRLGAHTSEMPRYLCEEGYSCDDETGKNGYTTQVGLNLVSVSTSTATLDAPLSAFGYPDDQRASGSRKAYYRVKTPPASGWLLANMRVAGAFELVAVDAYDNPLSNFPITMSYEPPPTLNTPPAGGSLCRSGISTGPNTAGGVLKASEYDLCAAAGTPVRQSDCPGSPSATSSSSVLGVVFYPVLGASPDSWYRFPVTDGAGNRIAVAEYPTYGRYCASPDPNRCACAEPGVQPLISGRTALVNGSGNMIEAYVPGSAAKAGFATDVLYEKAAIQRVFGSDGKPHYFAIGTNEWAREPLEDSVIAVAPTTPGTQAGAVAHVASGRYEGEMRMGPTPQLNSLKYEYQLFPPTIPYLPSGPQVTPPPGVQHEVDPAYVDPVTLEVRRVKQPDRPWKGEGSFSLWGVKPALTGLAPSPVRVSAGGTVLAESVISGAIEPPEYAPLLERRQTRTDVDKGGENVLSFRGVGGTIAQGSPLPAGEYAARLSVREVTPGGAPLASEPLRIISQPLCQLLAVKPSNLTVTSTYSPWDHTRCPNGEDLTFALCEAADVSITIGGRELASGRFAAGSHAVAFPLDKFAGLQPAEPGNDKAFAYVIQARAVAEPHNSASLAGKITLQDACNRSVLPVGRTFVKGVDLFDGHLVRQATDLKVPGRHLGLEVTRTYASSGQDPEGLMGAGWAFNYEASLILSRCGLVVVKTADGSSQVFRSLDNGATYQPQPGYHTRLVHAADGSFDFYDKAGVRYRYESAVQTRRRLLEVVEPHGDRLVFTYHSADVERVREVGEYRVGTSAPVRRLVLAYSDDSGSTAGLPGGYPRIASAAIPELRLEASYSYDTFGNLVRVTRRGLNLLGGGPDAEATEERYEYSTGDVRDRHQLTAAVDANGHRTEFVFFAAAEQFPGEADGAVSVDDKEEHVRLVRELASQSAPIETRFAYDVREVLSAQHWKTQVTDARGNSTLYVLNLNGSPVEIDEPLGKTTLMGWAANDITKEWERDANGRETQFGHDANGNLTSERIRTGDSTIPGAAGNGDVTATYAYHPAFNKLTRKTDALGHTTTYTIDEQTDDATLQRGDLTDVLDAAGNHTHHDYDDAGQLLQTTDPRGNVTAYSDWDSFGNPRRSDGPGGYWKQREYDARGRLTREWDSLGHETRTSHDGFDRPVEVRRVSGRDADEVNRTWYYPDGQPSAVMNSLGAETAYTLDGLDRVVSARTTVPAGRSFEILTTYDGNGNKETETDARGITRRFVSDALNRVTQVEILGGPQGEGPTGTIASYGYDLVGNKRSETDVNGLLTQYAYDGLYRLYRRTLPVAKPGGTGNWEEQFRYDAAGNLRRSTDANGRLTETEYDGLGRVLKLTRDAGGLNLVTTTAYEDPGGSRVNKSEEHDVARGLGTSYSYDPLNRETSRTVRLEGEDGDPATGVATYTTATVYEDAQHAQRTTDPRGVVTLRTLDGLDRVVQETVDIGGLDGAPALALQTTTAYDGLGNKTAVTDPENRTTRYEYDGLGRPVRTIDAKGQESSLSYFADGLKESETDRRGVRRLFGYDNLGRRRTSRLAASPFSGVPWSQETRYVDGPQPKRIEIDARGKSTVFELDGLGRVVRETDALGQYRTFGWDGVNKREETDKRPAHNRTLFEYDGINRLVKTTDPLQHSVAILYEDAANRATETDKRGIREVTQTDPLGRIVGTTRAVGTADEAILERNSYDGNGNKTSATDAEGKTTRFAYDAANRLSARTDGFGTDDAATTTYAYDTAGNLTEERDARAAALGEPWSVKKTYDDLNRLLTETDGEGDITRYGYDPEGNRTSVQTPKGPTTAYAYDELGKLITVTQPPPAAGEPSPVTRYAYDANRNRIRQTDANGHVVTMEYDVLNRLRKTVQDPGRLDLTTETLQFDENGNPLVIRDPKLQKISSTFDELNRLKTKSYAFAPSDPQRPWRHTTQVDYSYDENSNLLRQDETVASGTDPPPPASIVRTYDLFDRLATETVQLENGNPVPAPVAKTLSYSYWKNGLRKTATDPESGVTSYGYDGRNQLKTVTAALGDASYSYHGDGLLHTLTQPDDSLATYEYDKADRLVSLTHAKGDAPIASYGYSYDANGNRLTQLETNGSAAETTSYTYDDLDRLSTITYPDKKVAYGYDAVGNRTRETETTLADALVSDKQAAFDAVNRLETLTDVTKTEGDPARLVSFDYDANGNQASKTENGVTTSYMYDIRDKLAEVRQGASILSRFKYDAEGRLLKKIGSDGIRQYVYDQTSRLAEYDETGTAVARFHYGSDRLLSMWHRSEGTRFYHLDGLRSVTALTDTSGAVTARLHLNAWGELRDPNEINSTTNRFTFTGHIWEPEIGLYATPTRYFDPKLGRFLTQDSYLGRIDEPPSLHRYLYAANRPTVYIDPTGHDFTLDKQKKWGVDGVPAPVLSGTVTYEDTQQYLGYAEKYGTREQAWTAALKFAGIYATAHAQKIAKDEVEGAAAVVAGAPVAIAAGSAAAAGAVGGAVGGFVSGVLDKVSAAEVAVRTTAGTLLGAGLGWAAQKVGAWIAGEASPSVAGAGRSNSAALKPVSGEPAPAAPSSRTYKIGEQTPVGVAGEGPGTPADIPGALVSDTAATSGETTATRIGKEAHAAMAAERRAGTYGDFDRVNQPIVDPSGNPAQVPHRVDLRTGEPQPGTYMQESAPDAVSYGRRLIIDDKPLGRPIAKDRQEIIRAIRAYKASQGTLPARIAIPRYDPKTGEFVRTDLYTPSDFLPRPR